MDVQSATLRRMQDSGAEYSIQGRLAVVTNLLREVVGQRIVSFGDD